MLNDPRSHGLWETTAPAAPEMRALAGAVQADVVIVGGGFTGLSSALHLAEGGMKPVVLEAVDVGFGASGRNTGYVNAGLWVMPSDMPGTLGEVHGERMLQLLGNSPSVVWNIIDKYRIECEATRNGTLHCGFGASGMRELEERERQWSRRGAPVKLLDKAETSRRIGTDIYSGSLFDKRAGTIQPLAYVRGLARAAMGMGARVYNNSRVVGVEEVNGKWTVRTASGSVTADWVIVATDAYTVSPWSGIRAEQMHLPYFNIATRPLSDNLGKIILPNLEGCWDTRKVMTSIRRDARGRLVVGSIGALRGTGLQVHREWARRALRKIFPQLGDIAFEAEWYGLIGMTENHLPRFHKLARNMVGICGYNGRGIAPGTVFGGVLARYILGQLTEADFPLPVSETVPAHWRGLREAYYETGAQLAHFVGARV